MQRKNEPSQFRDGQVAESSINTTTVTQTMSLEIIGTESMGVKSLCCLVALTNRRIVIDPAVALGNPSS
jgi:hypothetical protein